MAKRIITALLGLPIIVAVLIFADKYIFSVFITAVAIITLWEYFNAFKGKAKPVAWIGFLACLLIIAIQFIPKEYLIYVATFSLPIICAILFIQIIVTNMKTTVNDAIITFFGIAYVVGFLIFLPMIFALNSGRLLIWYVLVASWVNDMCAYFVGSKFGKHKFTAISPKKSIEGCIGGILGAIIFSQAFTYIFNIFFNAGFAYLKMGIMIAILAIISQFGDLAASTIKRYTGIKDSGNLFPGHGGMLDRIDSILFIAPFTYLFFII